MKYSIIFLTLALASSTCVSSAQPSTTLTGSWTAADQSIVRVYACGTNTVCAQLVWLKDSASVDDKNPDPSLRKRALCGITLGTWFELVDAANAKGGKLYDPGLARNTAPKRIGGALSGGPGWRMSSTKRGLGFNLTRYSDTEIQFGLLYA